QKLLERLRSVKGRHHTQQLAIEAPNGGSVGSTEPNRAFGDSFKYRLKIECRAANDLEHLRCGGLLLQGFGKIACALAKLVEQPRILNGDDGLGSEILHQLDLFVGERPHLLAKNAKNSKQLVVFEQGYGDNRACIRIFGENIVRLLHLE